MNRVVITGVINMISSDDGACGHLTVSCPMLMGKKKEEEIVVNYPIIEFNRKTKPENPGKVFKRGDRVSIYGHVQSYLRKQANGTSVENIFIYADSIMHEKSKFEKVFGIQGRIYDAQKNDVYVKGVVNGVSRLSGGSGFELSVTPEREERNRIRVIYFRGGDSFEKQVHVGSKIALVAMVQSQEVPEVRDRTGYNMQSIVASDIVLIK